MAASPAVRLLCFDLSSRSCAFLTTRVSQVDGALNTNAHLWIRSVILSALRKSGILNPGTERCFLGRVRANDQNVGLLRQPTGGSAAFCNGRFAVVPLPMVVSYCFTGTFSRRTDLIGDFDGRGSADQNQSDASGRRWPKNNGIRIDHLLLSPEAADRMTSAAIEKHVRAWEKPSDHVPVIAYFDFAA
ncbi:endonuclease/exonuclease/phosphatase family protein [Rhizobium sp. NXC14]|nr:endonuclease/exonuclease/phosphatase family protein [Rhizobium sp. NXC14]